MKKILKTLLVSIMLIANISCSEEGFEISGKVESAPHIGFKCWFLVDSASGRYYELVSSDELLLQEGKKVKARVVDYTESKTICNVGDKVKILAYKFLN